MNANAHYKRKKERERESAFRDELRQFARNITSGYYGTSTTLSNVRNALETILEKYKEGE